MENSSLLNNSLNETIKLAVKTVQWHTIILGIALYFLVILTVCGNVLVLVAIYKEKKLQTIFNLYIVNLAITDIGVASTAMSFYIIDNILGYWPFGEFVCGFWIFCDYGFTFASVFTLIVISVDRFWSISWSVHYRANHKRKKSYVCIAIVWIIMVVLWLPACITDRVKNHIHQLCIWEPSKNSEFVVVIAVVGHHGSCFVMLFCYIQVFLFIRKRAKVGGLVTSKIRVTSIETTYQDVTTRTHNNTMLRVQKDVETPSTSNTEATPTPTEATPTEATVKDNRTKPISSTLLNVPQTKAENIPRPSQKETFEKTEEIFTIRRERKVFVTLSYIIVGYIICWVPFHIVFDISAVKPESVPAIVYTITFWMTYLNSTINPFLYNFSSPEFRDAFRMILCKNRIR